MADNNDGASKGPGKPGVDAPGAKKPSAIIDLKASEIRGPAATQASQADSKPQAPAASAPPAPPPGKTTENKQAAKPQPGQPAAVKPPVPPRQSFGLASVASHTFAGLAGGFLALLGADTISQQMGLSGAALNNAELQRRLASVEATAMSKPVAAVVPDLTQKLAAAEVRLAKIEDLGRTISALSEDQAKLAAATKQLDDKLGSPDFGADAARLARLEDTLTALAAAASTDPQKGRIPQLAQITGKLVDLEGSLNTQMAAARKSVTQDVDARLGQSTEAAEAARSGVQRLDRDLAAIKSDSTRNTQRLDTLDQSVRANKDDASSLKTAVDSLKNDLAAQLKSVARPQDVSSALAPLSAKLSAVEQNLAGVVKSDDERRVNAERIVLSLELANLKRALDRGGGYASELAEVQKAAREKLDLKALDAFKDNGVPTVAGLANNFRNIAYAIINADTEPAEASVVDRLLAGALSMVRVRKTSSDTNDNSAEAVVARMDGWLKSGRLAEVVAEAGKLSPKARAAASAWLDRVEARASIDRAVAGIETQLKAALGGKPAQ